MCFPFITAITASCWNDPRQSESSSTTGVGWWLLTSLPPPPPLPLPRCWIRVQPPGVCQARWRMRVDRPESFSKLRTAENHCGSSRKTSTWAGGLPLTGVIFSADLPRTEERGRVSVQHKGVSQRLHIIPRRGEWPLSSTFSALMVPCCHTLVCIFSPWSGVCECVVFIEAVREESRVQ